LSTKKLQFKKVKYSESLKKSIFDELSEIIKKKIKKLYDEGIELSADLSKK